MHRFPPVFVFTAVVVAAAAVPSAFGSDRVVQLEVPADARFPRVRITNPSSQPITFSLGFNDQLFENKKALLRHVRQSRAETCRQLPSRLTLPCTAYAEVASSLFHFPELTDQLYDNGVAGRARLWVESPMLVMNSFGFGTCGTFADVLAKIWQQLGYQTRRRVLNGHTVTEAKVGRKWVLFDANMQGYFPRGKGVLGIDDLLKNKKLATTANARLLPFRPNDYPHARFSAYKPVLESSTGAQLLPSAVLDGPADWRDLTFTIPPGGRLVFPEESIDECYSPLLYDKSNWNQFFNPPHHYAIVEVPKGTTVNIENGLYTARVTGDYCANVRYQQSETAQTDHYDQVRRFRAMRRFAVGFAPLEAYSDVLIYYMLNTNVTVGRTNEVRLHGDGVTDLVVTTVSAADANLPPGFDGECIDSTSDQPLRVQTVSATSYSYGNHDLGKLLIDDRLTSGWISDFLNTKTPQQIVLDLGSPSVVGGIRLAPFDPYPTLAPESIEIETSLDGETYASAVNIPAYRPSSVEWLTTSFDPRPARYIRLTGVPPVHFLNSTKFQMSLAEVQVLAGTLSDVPNPAPAVRAASDERP